MSKVVNNAQEAIAGVESGMTLLLGGFGLCGIPDAEGRRYCKVPNCDQVGVVDG